MVTSVLICRWLKGGAANFLTAEQVCLTNKRSGRHLAATDNDVVKKIDQFIRTDRRVSISDIVLYTGISRGSVHTVVHDHLKFHKVSARWVPRQLKPEQQAVRMIISDETVY